MAFLMFGEKIRELRHSHGLTLTQLAAKLDMDSANLSKVETGKRDFDDKRLPALCKVFNLNTEEMRIELLSELFASKANKNNVDVHVFSLAEEKAKYMAARNFKQAKIDF